MMKRIYADATKLALAMLALLAVFFVLAVLFSTPAQAQEKFTIGGGGDIKKSTYSAMLFDLAQVCSTDDLNIEIVQSPGGGVENLDKLKAQKIKGGIVQTDTILATKRENPTSVARLKTLFTLHPEEVHLIARADVKTEGGVSAFGKNLGGKDVAFNTTEDLRGRPIGAVGGTVRTAEILNAYLKIGYTIQSFTDNKVMIDALTAGKIDAVMVVAGAPSGTVEGLPPGRFKFIPIRSNAEVAELYSPTKVQYSNVSGGRAVDTISTQAILVVRTFQSEEMQAALGKLRACMFKNLAKIQDKDGAHPKWADVHSNDRGKWEWYDLPLATAAAVPAAPAPAPVAKKK